MLAYIQTGVFIEGTSIEVEGDPQGLLWGGEVGDTAGASRVLTSDPDFQIFPMAGI